MAKSFDHVFDVLALEADGEPPRIAKTVFIDTFAFNVKVVVNLDVEGEVTNHARIHELGCKELCGFLEERFLFTLANHTSDRDVHIFVLHHYRSTLPNF